MFKALPRTFVIFKMYRGRLIISQILLLISAISRIGVATLTQRLINQGIVAGDSTVIVNMSVWMAVLALVGGLAMAGTAGLAVFFAQGVAFGLRKYLYQRIQGFSFANFDRFRTGNLMVRLNADVNNVANAILYSVMLILFAPFMILVAFVLTYIFSPSLLWVLVLVTVVVIAFMAFLLSRIVRAYDERQARLDRLNNTLQENLAGVRVVKAFVREKLEITRFRKRADDMRKPAFTAAFLTAAMNPALTAVTQFAIAIAIWSGGEQVLKQTGMQVGDLVAFMQYLSLIVMPLAMMAIVFPFLMRGETSAQRIFEVMDAEPVVVDKPEAKPVEPEEIKGRLVFENVSFAFQRPDGEFDPPALKNINLTIEPGERVGFLGATGSGKTALVNLIPRFYDVTEGRITIDGVDVRDFPQDNLREIAGIALQEALLFQGDIRFNLKFGAPEVDDPIMWNAAKAADAYGFIENLPQKWDAPVARRGNNFSGGQRQRLAISRTLTTLPRILILDDSTSALDVATEARVQEAIPGFVSNATTLYVAQRISAVIDLEKIVLMANGEIVAQGTHEELMASSPLYQEIYESQLGGGIAADLEVSA